MDCCNGEETFEGAMDTASGTVQDEENESKEDLVEKDSDGLESGELEETQSEDDSDSGESEDESEEESQGEEEEEGIVYQLTIKI